MSDRTKTWMEASGQHWDSELLKSYRSNIQDGHHGFMMDFVCGNNPLMQHGDSELLKPFCSDIQDGSHLEILQTTSHEKHVRLN